MNKLGKLALLAAIATPGMVWAQVNVGDVLGFSETAIRSALEAKGYVISKIEPEDDELEVQAAMDGKAYEIEVSTESGEILEIEREEPSDDS